MTNRVVRSTPFVLWLISLGAGTALANPIWNRALTFVGSPPDESRASNSHREHDAKDRIDRNGAPPQADLRVQITVSPSQVQPGNNLTYKITLTNLGPGNASDITVTDTLPSTTTFVSCSSTVGQCQGSDVNRRVHLNQLNSTKSATITLVAKVKTSTPNGRTIVHEASAKARGSSDPHNSNNSASVSATTSAGGGGGNADLGLGASAMPNPVAPSSNVTYTLSVTNPGPATANSVTVTDNLPLNTTFVSCSATGGGSCGGSGRVRSITFSSLAVSGSTTITIVAKVQAGTPNGIVLDNTTIVSAATPDGLVANNSAVTSVTVGSSSPRNIVVILTDDQPDHLLSLMPQVNALIGNQGVRFSKFYVSTALCSPSRATLLTGQYSHNNTVTGNGNSATRLDDTSTIATWLRDSGYRTALVGKYLNNYDQIVPYVPPGWSEWRVFVNTVYYNFDLIVNGTRVHYDNRPSNYATTVLADHAVRVIEETPSGQPLFLLFAPFSPHTPAKPAPADEHAFDGLAPYRPPSYNETNVNDKPLWIRLLPLLSASDSQKQAQQHEDMAESLLSVDRAAADIVDALSRTGRLSNTVLIFTSDNGWSAGAHRWERKSCSYEECIKQPLLIRAPGIAPRTESALVSNVDLAPTIAQLAGVTAPGLVNGRSLVPLLTNPATPWRDALLIEYLGDVGLPQDQFYGLRNSRYMYAEYENGDRELYDLNLDPFELDNVIDDPDYNSVESTLRAQLQDLKND